MIMKCKRNEDENENENELTNERMTELMNQRNNEPVKQWINESMNQWISEPMNQWTNESMNQRINESLNQWINESMNQWNLPTSSSKSALKPSVFKLFMWNRALPTVSCTFCLANSTMPKKKRSERVHLFAAFMWNRALVTVLCTFCRPHLPKVLQTCHFLRFLYEIELSLQSRAHSANLIFQKCSEHVNLFSDFFVKPSSRYSLVHISPISSSKSAPNVTAFQHIQAQIELSLQPCARSVDRGPQPQKQRPYFSEHGGHFTRKKHRVSRPSLFKPEFTRSRPVTLPNYLMMMWLTWWCVGMMVRMLPMTIVRNSEVF